MRNFGNNDCFILFIFRTINQERNMFTFPQFLAFCLAIVLNIFDLHFPVFVSEILQKIGSPFTVLALVSVGF